MIIDELQYRITHAEVRKFEVALEELAKRPPNPKEHPKLRQVRRDGLMSQLEVLQAQVQEYDDLKAGN